MSETPVPILTPHRALRLELLPADSSALDDGAAGRLAAAFDRGSGHGLLQLGAAEAGSRLTPDLAFWRGFAVRFVAAVCAGGEPSTGGAPRVSQPTKDDLILLIDEAPPMRGGEYLDVECLASLWRALERALDDELLDSGLPIQAFLQNRDSRWRLVGRVHFNLAENRKDSDRPFAFMATYASTLGAQGALRHLGLGHALREYAGAGAKAELLRLLEPVNRASENSAWLREIVEFGRNFPSPAVDPQRSHAAPFRCRDARARRRRRAHAGGVAKQQAEPPRGRGDGGVERAVAGRGAGASRLQGRSQPRRGDF